MIGEGMMIPGSSGRKPSQHFFIIALAAALAVSLSFAGAAVSAGKQKAFTTADDAVKAFVSALRDNDEGDLLAIFGPPAKELISSGDPVSDRQRRERFLKAYDEKNNLVPEGDGMILNVGQDGWPFPVPVVKKGNVWVFDTKQGKQEILNRRIGENELNTIQTMLAIVDAQREYAMNDRDGDGLLEYAQKFWSDPGKKNGLFWETGEGKEPSPVGPLVAKAMRAGYQRKQSGEKPSPYYGYLYKTLTAQGENAPGGAFDYIVQGKMIGGFAIVAYPARYGNSGIMTFMVNHDGVPYQKDLGRNTGQKAKAMKKFDPDKMWKKVE
jgi:hypothetical protein